MLKATLDPQIFLAPQKVNAAAPFKMRAGIDGGIQAAALAPFNNGLAE